MKITKLIAVAVLLCIMTITLAGCGNTITGKYYVHLTGEQKEEMKQGSELSPQDMETVIENVQNMYFQLNKDNTFTYHIMAAKSNSVEESYNFLDLSGTYTVDGDTISVVYSEDSLREYYDFAIAIAIMDGEEVGESDFEDSKEMLMRTMNIDYIVDSDYKTLTSKDNVDNIIGQYKKR